MRSSEALKSPAEETSCTTRRKIFGKSEEKFYTGVKSNTESTITQGSPEITTTSTPTLNQMAAYFGDDADTGKAYIASLGYTVW